jgi:peptidoglycan/LPS O-acetylase OafA/YrhL
MLIGSAATLIMFGQHGIDATYDLGLVRCLYGFLVGHVTYRLWQAVSRARFNARFLEAAALIAVVVYVSVVGRTGYSFFAPLVFAVVVLVFAFESGPVSRLMSNRANDWLGRISYSLYMWQAFIIFNFVDRPVSIIEKMTGRVLTTTEGVSSALGNEASKLIVLGGHFLPILVTLLFVGFLVAVASVSYYLIEKPGQQLFARLAGRQRRSGSLSQDGGRSRSPVQSAGVAS